MIFMIFMIVTNPPPPQINVDFLVDKVMNRSQYIYKSRLFFSFQFQMLITSISSCFFRDVPIFLKVQENRCESDKLADIRRVYACMYIFRCTHHGTRRWYLTWETWNEDEYFNDWNFLRWFRYNNKWDQDYVFHLITFHILAECFWFTTLSWGVG